MSDDGSSSDGESSLPKLGDWHTKSDLDTEDGYKLRQILRKVQKDRVHLGLVKDIVDRREKLNAVEEFLSHKVLVPVIESNSFEDETQNNLECDKHTFNTSISYVCCGTKVFDVERFQCVFRVEDVTFTSCGYNIFSDVSNYEKDLLCKNPVWILRNLPKVLLIGRPHNVTNSSAFLLYLLQVASVTDSLPLLHCIEGHIKIFLNTCNSKPFISVEEILKIFINFGMTVEPHFPSEILKSVHDNLKNTSAIRTFENRPVKDRHWFNNFNVTISILDHLLEYSEIKDRHLLELFLIVLWMCVDETLLHSEIRPTLKNYLNHILEKFSVEFLNSGEVSTAISKLGENDSLHYPLLLEVIKVIPIYSAKGKKIKQASSYKALCCLIQSEKRLTDDKVEFSDLLFTLKKFHHHLCSSKTDLLDPMLDTMISLIDYCAGFDPVLKKQSVTDLNNILGKCKLKIKDDRVKEHFERMIFRFQGYIFEQMFLMLHFAREEKSFKKGIDISEEKEIDIDAPDVKRLCRKITNSDELKSPFKDFKKPFLLFQNDSDQKTDSNKDLEVAMEENCANTNPLVDDSISQKTSWNSKIMSSEAEHSTSAIFCSQQKSKSILNESIGCEHQVQSKPYCDQTIVDGRSGDENMIVSNPNVEVHNSNNFVNETCISNINPASSLVYPQVEYVNCHSELLQEAESMSVSDSETDLSDIYDQQNPIIDRTKKNEHTSIQSPNKQLNLVADETSVGENVIINHIRTVETTDFGGCTDKSFVPNLDPSWLFEPEKDTRNQELYQSLKPDLNYYFEHDYPVPHHSNQQMPISDTTIKNENQTSVKSDSHQEVSLLSGEMSSGENEGFHNSANDKIKIFAHSVMPFKPGEQSSRKNGVLSELGNTLISNFGHNYHLPDEVHNHEEVNPVSDVIKNGHHMSVEPHCHQKLDAAVKEISGGENVIVNNTSDIEAPNVNGFNDVSFISDTTTCLNFKLPIGIEQQKKNISGNNKLSNDVENVHTLHSENDCTVLVEGSIHLHRNLVTEVSTSESSINKNPAAEMQCLKSFCDSSHMSLTASHEDSRMSHMTAERKIEDFPDFEMEDLSHSEMICDQRVNSVCEEVSDCNQAMLVETHNHQNVDTMSERMEVQSIEKKAKNADGDASNASGYAVTKLVSYNDVSSFEQSTTPKQSTMKMMLNDDSFGLQDSSGNNDLSLFNNLEQSVNVFNAEQEIVLRSCSTVNMPLKRNCVKCQSEFTVSAISDCCTHGNCSITKAASQISTSDLAAIIRVPSPGFNEVQRNETMTSRTSLNQLNNHSTNFIAESIDSTSGNQHHASKEFQINLFALSDQLSNIDIQTKSLISVSDLEKVNDSNTQLNNATESESTFSSFNDQLESDISKIIFNSSNNQLTDTTVKVSSTGSILGINVQSKFVIPVSKDVEVAEAQVTAAAESPAIFDSFDDQLDNELAVSKANFDAPDDQLDNESAVSKANFDSLNDQLDNGSSVSKANFDSFDDQLDNKSAVSKAIFDSFHGELDNVKVKVGSNGSVLDVNVHSELVIPILEGIGSDMPSNEVMESQIGISLESVQSVNEMIADDFAEFISPIRTENMRRTVTKDFQVSSVLRSDLFSSLDVDADSATSDDSAPKELENTAAILLAAVKSEVILQFSDKVPKPTNTSISRAKCQKTTMTFDEPCSSFTDSGVDIVHTEQTFSSEETMDDEVQIIEDVPLKTLQNELRNVSASVSCKLIVPPDQPQVRASMTDMQSSNHTSHMQLLGHNARHHSVGQSSSELFSKQSSASENIWSTVKSGVQAQQFTANLFSQSQNPTFIIPPPIVYNRQDINVQSNIPSWDSSRIVENPHQDSTYSAQKVSSSDKSRTLNNSPEPIVITDDDDDDLVIVFERSNVVFID